MSHSFLNSGTLIVILFLHLFCEQRVIVVHLCILVQYCIQHVAMLLDVCSLQFNRTCALCNCAYVFTQKEHISCTCAKHTKQNFTEYNDDLSGRNFSGSGNWVRPTIASIAETWVPCTQTQFSINTTNTINTINHIF